MQIYYQWYPWAYSDKASQTFNNKLEKKLEILWVPDFKSVWEEIDNWNIWVLPIENSKAWSIHENLYNFLRYDAEIIWEINLEINHNLLSKETDISNIKIAYSHPQAISQCHDFLKNNNIKWIAYWDTAWAAQMISKSNDKWVASISSKIAWELYNLNIVKENIQDQEWNTTRFFIVKKRELKFDYKEKSKITSIIFEARNIPASLYKCLWAFATNWVNLTKIESLPSLKWQFTYLFWIDFEWDINSENTKKALEELKFFTNEINVLN